MPLIVVDPSIASPATSTTIRSGLTSSVDLLPLLVSLGHNGSRDWMTGELAPDLRPAARHAADAAVRHARRAGPMCCWPRTNSFPACPSTIAPTHVVGIRTHDAKLGTYSKWNPVTGRSCRTARNGVLRLRHDADGLPELASTPDDPRAKPLLDQLLNNLIPNELRAPLPGRYAAAQTISKEAYLLFQAAIDSLTPDGFTGQNLRDLLGFGAEF